MDDDQFKTPLFDAMVTLAESRKVSFHTPGHKSGKGISTRFRKFVGPKIFSIDLTTLDEVDSLHAPKGVIKQAQELAAIAYGADFSFFLINGTTGGNHAMVLNTCGPEDTVLVARNAHKSVLAGLIFSGARPVFYPPLVDETLKMTLNVTPDATAAAIEAHPEAKILLLTTPNYYGLCADIKQIIPYAHEKGLTVLVDEAHGPHLHFHPELPPSAMNAGADIVVQSTHKIIGGMTQASMLHAKKDRIDRAALAAALKLLQSTSPSYILMASLDLARMQMATEGTALLEKAIRLAQEARKKINTIPGLFCLDAPWVAPSLFCRLGGLDTTKLTISVQNLGLSGYQVSKILNTQYGIQVEMADPLNVLVIVSIGDRRDDLNRLVNSLREISKEYQGKHPLAFEKIALPPVGKPGEMRPRDAFFSNFQYIPLSEAKGKISTEIITIYPPGIPVLVPGEQITEEVVTYIVEMDKLGATVDGLDSQNRTIAVVK